MTDRKRTQSVQAEKTIDKTTNGGNPCLFLIHVSVNRDAAAAIGEYIAVRGGMDIYLDFNNAGPPEMAGGEGFERDRYLMNGLTKSTHVLGLIPPEAPEPWWMGRLQELAGSYSVELALLTLKGMAEGPEVSSYIQVLRGIKSLNEYLFRVSPKVDRIIFNNPEYGGLMAHTAPNHPLDAFLDWNH